MFTRQIVTLLCFAIASAAIASAAIAAEPPAPKHLFILSGQSNMRPPLIPVFKETIEAIFGKDNVIVTSQAHPGQPIHRWYKNWLPPDGGEVPERRGEIYDRMIATVRRAVKEQPLATVTFIWMQGEQDARNGWADVYEKSFFGVLDQLKADLGVDKINYVIGRINDYWVPPDVVDGDKLRALQVKMAEAHPHGAWINTDDLNKGVNPWGGFSFADGHFPNPGYRVMAQRFARAASKLIDPAIKLDESLFVEAFIDAADQIGSHAALGKSLTGTTPDAKQSLSALTDGSYGTPTADGSAWLAFGPENQTVELIVDLGKETEVSAVGFNLLLNKALTAGVPAKIRFYVSTDGTEFVDLVGSRQTISFSKKAQQLINAADFQPQAILVLRDYRPKSARFVKATIELDQRSKARVLLDEFIVNPVKR